MYIYSIFIQMKKRIHTYIHTYTHTHIHTYIHTHTLIYIYACMYGSPPKDLPFQGLAIFINNCNSSI